MPFRCKQKFIPDGLAVGLNVVLSIGQNGFAEEVKEKFSKELPPVEMYDPAACIKAGVNLEQVNTKVLSPAGVSNIFKDEVKNEE